jgi:hypothetical protein
MLETPLMTFVLGVLTNFLMTGGITDPAIARLAAQEAIAAYKAAGRDQVLTVGSIAAFALAALDDLRLSIAPELSTTLKLRLRANANALDRSARENTKLLPAPEQPVSQPAATPKPPVPSEAENRREWANAMTRAANDLKANAANVPPAEQAVNQLWIQALSTAASGLTRPRPPQAGGKMDLLRSTIMASAPAFPDLGPKANPAPPSASAAGAPHR